MDTRKMGFVVSLVVVLAAVWAPASLGQDLVHGRVSFDSGGGLVKGAQDEDWSYATTNTLVLPGDILWVDEAGQLELEMPGDAFLRMADGTKAEITALPPQGLVRGWTGAFYLQRTARSTGDFSLETPAAIITPDTDTNVRIDVLANGSTTVTVRWGGVSIRTSDGNVDHAATGQRVYVDPGFHPSEPQPFDRNAEDAFDAWNRERAQQLAKALESVPVQMRTTSVPIGAADLAPYGEWVNVDDTPYWRPTVVVDYVPYRTGHWSYVPATGYVWVGDYPFGYVTSHYGRWHHHATYGWIWTYRPEWSPAWCATVQYGSNFVWAPLDPWDRPACYDSDYFIVGGVRIGISAATFCAMDDVLIGVAYVRPVTPVIIHDVPPSQITIWNIYIGDHHRGDRDGHRDGRDGHHDRDDRDGHRDGRDGHHDRDDRDGRRDRDDHRDGRHWGYDDSVAVRDHAPRRVVRGADEDRERGGRARERVSTLESREDRPHDFHSARREDIKPQRTTADDTERSRRVRSVRVDPNASDVEQVRNRVGERIRQRDPERRGDRPTESGMPAPIEKETPKPQRDDRREQPAAREDRGGIQPAEDARPSREGTRDRERDDRGGQGNDAATKPNEAAVDQKPSRDRSREDNPRPHRDRSETAAPVVSDDKPVQGETPRATTRTRTPSPAQDRKPSERKEVLRNPDRPADVRPVPRERNTQMVAPPSAPVEQPAPTRTRAPRMDRQGPPPQVQSQPQAPRPEPIRAEQPAPNRWRSPQADVQPAPQAQPTPEPPRRAERPEPPRAPSRQPEPQPMPQAQPAPERAPRAEVRNERPQPVEAPRQVEQQPRAEERRGRGTDDVAPDDGGRRGGGRNDDRSRGGRGGGQEDDKGQGGRGGSRDKR